MSPEGDSQVAAVKAAAEALENATDTDTVELSNGVILRTKRVNLMTLRHAYATIPRPKPPIVRNEEKSRDEEWDQDPVYLQALEDWEQKVGDVGVNIMFSIGTSIEYLPEDIEPPESDKWLEQIRAIGIEADVSSDAARYISWMRFYIVETPQDLLIITSNISRKSGVLDKDVQTSLESFRSGDDGKSDSGVPTEERSGDRDPVSNANGRSHLRDRGEG